MKIVHAQLAFLAVCAAILPGCAKREPKTIDVSTLEMPSAEMMCEMEGRRLDRDNPRACALPTAPLIERDCAINDLLASPDYKPEYDDEGEEINPKPLPEYRVSDLVCKYDGSENNRASCTFGLALPGEALGARKSNAQLGYRKWSHSTPLTFSYGMRWYVDGLCMPQKQTITPSPASNP